MARYVAHQAYYSLVGRDYEWELMPLALDQEVGTRGLEPAGLGPADRQDPPRRSRCRQSAAATSRPTTTWARPSPTNMSIRWSTRSTPSPRETGKTVPQIALNWLLQRPTVATVIIGARNEEQLRAESGRARLAAATEQIARLDAASTAHCRIPIGTSGPLPNAIRRRCRFKYPRDWPNFCTGTVPIFAEPSQQKWDCPPPPRAMGLKRTGTAPAGRTNFLADPNDLSRHIGGES